MKYKKLQIFARSIAGSVFFVAALSVLLSCSETWEGHYDTDGTLLTADRTLWEEIASRSELAAFRAAVERTPYRNLLDGDQMFTVFAPFGAIDTEGLTAEALTLEVVENHVARFPYSANSLLHEPLTLRLMNGKTGRFAASADGYTFGERALTQVNIGAKNGVLHIIDGQVPFFCNVWEFMDKDTAYSAVRDYLYSFNRLVLDADASVAGAVVDGEITYVDSVVVTDNEMFRRIGLLNNEDSTYWMVLPTNTAWRKAYDRVSDYYTYSAKNPSRDSLQRLYTQMALVNDLVFSRPMQASPTDSLTSTTGGVFHQPLRTLLTEYASFDEGQPCSNGRVFPVDVLRYQPWESWQRAIQVEAENTRGREYALCELYKRNLNASSEYYTKVSDASYIEMVPSSTSANPSVTIAVPDVLSAAYDIKVVFLPQTLGTDRSTWGLPNKILANLTTVDADGKAVTVKSDVITNDPTRIDTVTVFEGYRFEACNYDEETVTTKLKLQSQVLSKERSEYSRTIMIDCVIVEPTKE
ncbi:MAG: fasciclin domain-containing protein [Bacteroidaceae bacterium]|nr:fasciclin domain-containing protein [Bacteroidaceae bacterium]